MQTGIELIASERTRQIEAEGWTPTHDAEHTDGSLAVAAACYALCADERDEMPAAWPWSPDWWKPKDTVRNLARAGALIAAEIDRLQRAQPNDQIQRAPVGVRWNAELDGRKSMAVRNSKTSVSGVFGCECSPGQRRADPVTANRPLPPNNQVERPR